MARLLSFLQSLPKVKWNPSERKPEVKSTKTENTSILLTDTEGSMLLAVGSGASSIELNLLWY